jgi:hypothetical protein
MALLPQNAATTNPANAVTTELFSVTWTLRFAD